MLFTDLPPLESFITVKRAKELDLIPLTLWEHLSNECNCGSERMARLSKSEEITGITCVDPHCIYKVAAQLADSFQKFGFKGLGLGTAFNILQNLPVEERHFADVLLRETPVYGLVDAQYEAYIQAMHHLNSQKFTRQQFIPMLMYPYIGEKVTRFLPENEILFSQVANAPSLEARIDLVTSYGIQSNIEQYYTAVFLSDIVRLCKKYSRCIINTTGTRIGVCMTGHMITQEGSYTKENYLAVCNDYLVNNRIQVTLIAVDSVSKATYVVAGDDAIATGTKKYRTGIKLEQDNIGSKVVYSPDEFMRTIQGSD